LGPRRLLGRWSRIVAFYRSSTGDPESDSGAGYASIVGALSTRAVNELLLSSGTDVRGRERPVR